MGPRWSHKLARNALQAPSAPSLGNGREFEQKDREDQEGGGHEFRALPDLPDLFVISKKGDD
jgi:hypothetical protein